MKLLVVAATATEVQPLVDRLSGASALSARLTSLIHGQHDLHVLVTGVGMVPTAVWCSRGLAEVKPDLVLNLGVCGSFSSALPPGTVVQVVSDRLIEVGAEDGEAFLTIQELGLLNGEEPPYRSGSLVNVEPPAIPALAHLPHVRGITVNTVHGDERTIARTVERWSPDVESMEGAAFMYACLTAGVPFAQVRAVSNRVERRNRAGWKMAEAISSLTDVGMLVIGDL